MAIRVPAAAMGSAPAGEAAALPPLVAITRASVTVTALRARTRRPWKRRSPSTVVSSTTRNTARLRSQ